jgi:hypothetical protein
MLEKLTVKDLVDALPTPVASRKALVDELMKRAEEAGKETLSDFLCPHLQEPLTAVKLDEILASGWDFTGVYRSPKKVKEFCEDEPVRSKPYSKLTVNRKFLYDKIIEAYELWLKSTGEGK